MTELLSTLIDTENGEISLMQPCLTPTKIQGKWGKNSSSQEIFIGKIVGDVENSDIYWDGDNVQFTLTVPDKNAGILVYI